MDIDSIRALMVRINDDIEAMYLLKPQTWTHWQKVLVFYSGLLVLLVALSLYLAIPKLNRINALRQEITALEGALNTVNNVQEELDTPTIPPCAIASYDSASHFLENQLNNSEIVDFERENLEGGYIQSEVRSEFNRLSTIVSCLSADEEWDLREWQMRRGGALISDTPHARFKLVSANEG